MTESTTTTEVVDISEGNVSPDRALRHSIRDSLNTASWVLTGRSGLTKDQQVERATKALEAVQTAVAELDTLCTLLANRDFEKFQTVRTDKSEADSQSDDDDDSDDDSDDDDTELFGQD